MKEFFIYFFTQGAEPEFALFTPAHFAPILVMIGVILLIRWKRDWIRSCKHEEAFRWVLAFMLIIADMSYYWRLVGCPQLPHSPVENLPIGVCCWSVILSSYMLVGKKQALFDIVYFWLFSGMVFALLTPTVLTYTGPTRYRYYQFWLEHTLGYVGIFYMIFVHGMRPTVKSAFRSLAVLIALALLAYWVNTMIPGANYLYLARPEAAPSVLDILPPNFALRTTIIVVVILLMYALAYLPWHLKDRKAAKTASVSV